RAAAARGAMRAGRRGRPSRRRRAATRAARPPDRRRAAPRQRRRAPCRSGRRPARSCAFASEPDESSFARASVLFGYPATAVAAQDRRTAAYHLAIGEGASIEVAERIAGDRLAKRLRVFVHLPRDGRALELGVPGPETSG